MYVCPLPDLSQEFTKRRQESRERFILYTVSGKSVHEKTWQIAVIFNRRFVLQLYKNNTFQ